MRRSVRASPIGKLSFLAAGWRSMFGDVQSACRGWVMGSLQEPVGSSLRSSNSAGVKSDPRAQAHGGDAYSGAPQELPAVEVHRFRRGLTVGDSPLRWKDDVSHGSSSDTQLGLAGSNVRGKVIEGTPGQCRLTVGDSPLRWKDDVSHGSSSDTQLGLAGSNVRGKVIEAPNTACRRPRTPLPPHGCSASGLHAGQEVVGLRGSFLR